MSKKLYLDFQADVLQIITEDTHGELNHELVPFDTSRPFSIEEVKDQIRQKLTDTQLQHVTWFDANFTLIPMSLFTEKELETYYHLNFGKREIGLSIQFEYIHSLQLVVIYAVPTWILELSQGALLQKSVRSHISFLLHKQFDQNVSDSIFLVLFHHTFVLSVKQNGKLQLCLPTEYQSATDVLYFILSNHQKMNLPKINTLSAYVLNKHFDQDDFESLWNQFKDFNDFTTHFYSQAAYQKTILCASSVVS
jgi:hypothetical protein